MQVKAKTWSNGETLLAPVFPLLFLLLGMVDSCICQAQRISARPGQSQLRPASSRFWLPGSTCCLIVLPGWEVACSHCLCLRKCYQPAAGMARTAGPKRFVSGHASYLLWQLLATTEKHTYRAQYTTDYPSVVTVANSRMKSFRSGPIHADQH